MKVSAGGFAGTESMIMIMKPQWCWIAVSCRLDKKVRD